MCVYVCAQDRERERGREKKESERKRGIICFSV